jgi:haloalkane dehalogenase
VDIVRSEAACLAASPESKLFINAEPGAITNDEREFCRTCPNTTEVTVSGVQFIQKDSPDEFGEAFARRYETDPAQ